MIFDPWPTLKELASSIKSGKTTSESLVIESIKRIESSMESRAVIELVGGAVEKAKDIDEKIAQGVDVGSLAGIPFLAKDNYLTFGSHTTASSKMLQGFKAPYQSTVVQLLEDEGAILVGKTNLDAFAHGGSTENSDFGVTKNPSR